MRQCILHVGMPKTGTSSIQNYLCRHLSDPNFLYIHFGEVNGTRALSTIGLEQPESYWVHRRNRVSPRRAARMRARYVKHLARSLRRAQDLNRTPILSGEGCWHLTRDQFLRLKALIHDGGFDVRVIAYLRPYRSWLESSFQQNVKWGTMRHNPLVSPEQGLVLRQPDYLRRLDHLAEAFGESNLLIRPFRRRVLEQGCAVRDFCAQLGIDGQGTSVPRSNDGISLDAIRLFYAYSRFCRETDPPTVRQTNALIHAMQSLTGEKLRFHPSVMAPVAEYVEQQRALIHERFGVDLGVDPGGPGDGGGAEDAAAEDGAGTVIRTEQDMYRFSPESLAWLAAQTGCAPIQGQGESAAREVALAVNRLRRRALWVHWRPLVRERLRMELNRWRPLA